VLDYIQPYLDYFTANPEWALIIVFLIAMGEALLIIGLFVPSTAVLVGAGVLVGTGHLGFWPVIAVTAVGCILGDQFSYWAGRLFGQQLKQMWPLSRYPQLVARGEDFVREHGGKSIAIGRFVPGVKSVVPGIVGMFGMNQLFFVFVNVTSGIAWSFAHIVPGVLIGQGLAFAGELSGRLLMVLVILLVILALAGYVIRLVAAGISPHLDRLLWQVAQWARAKPGRSWQRFARAVAPDNPRSVMIVLFAAIVFSGLLIMAHFAFRAVSGVAVSNLDISIASLMRESRNAPADEIMTVITMMGDTLVMTALALAIILWLVWHRAYRAAWAAGIAIAAAKIFELAMKFGVQRTRPSDLAYDGVSLYSFPSGHATMAAVIFGILAVLVSHAMGRWGRAVVYAMCALVVVAIAYSRVYLGAHWLSDVLTGLVFGTVMMAAFGVAVEAVPPRRIRPLGLMGAAFAVFLGVGALHVAQGFTSATEFYAMPDRRILVPSAQWLTADWQVLPVRRIDLAGRPGEVFVAQYAGSLENAAAPLAAAGWTAAPVWTWRDSLPYLNPDAALADLPPRPALHEGLKARLTLTRPVAGDPAARSVLRFYQTPLAVAEAGVYQPIYVVSLTREVKSHGLGLYAMPTSSPASDEERAALHALFAGAPGLAVQGTRGREGADLDLVTAAP
jgi:undecaprenyl-diphosphatase